MQQHQIISTFMFFITGCITSIYTFQNNYAKINTHLIVAYYTINPLCNILLHCGALRYLYPLMLYSRYAIDDNFTLYYLTILCVYNSCYYNFVLLAIYFMKRDWLLLVHGILRITIKQNIIMDSALLFTLIYIYDAYKFWFCTNIFNYKRNVI